MNRVYGNLIGKTIGQVLEIDVEDDDTSFGPFLRVQVKLNLNKPLTRGRSIQVKGENIWIPIKYEKLSPFCFHFGRIAHTENYNPNHANAVENQFGAWL